MTTKTQGSSIRLVLAQLDMVLVNERDLTKKDCLAHCVIDIR